MAMPKFTCVQPPCHHHTLYSLDFFVRHVCASHKGQHIACPRGCGKTYKIPSSSSHLRHHVNVCDHVQPETAVADVDVGHAQAEPPAAKRFKASTYVPSFSNNTRYFSFLGETCSLQSELYTIGRK